MPPRKRSLSAAKPEETPAPDDAPVVPIDASEPLPKRPKSDIDIIRARTAKLSAKTEPAPTPTPSEGAAVDEGEGEVKSEGEGQDGSSPLKTKDAAMGAVKGGAEGKGRAGKRGRGSRRRGGDRPVAKTEDGETKEEADAGGEGRRPKRKVVVALGYVGTGYNGSQVQVEAADGGVTIDSGGVKTIEGEIFKAFVKAGCISEDNSTDPSKVQLQRCCRTDANVHAACNVISLKLILDPPSLDSKASSDSSPASPLPPPALQSQALADHINTYLPPEIRIWGFVRVLGAFTARAMCESRTYEYSLPTYVFLPPKPGSAMYERLKECKGWLPEEQGDGGAGDVSEEARWWDQRPLDATFQADLEKKRSYRISPNMLARVRDAVSQFQGVHNYHNYTQGKDFRDRSATRIMRELTVSDPFIVEGTEWLSITLYGQSFMLHQIRKMVAMVILLCRTRTPSHLIPETFGPQRIRIPRAPGLGLLLVMPHFPGYNKRVAIQNERNKTEEREPLQFDGWQQRMDEFKRDWVYKRMWEDEKGEDSFASWLNYSDVFRGPNLDYLNPKGIIPGSAAVETPPRKASPAKSAASDVAKSSIATDVERKEDAETAPANAGCGAELFGEDEKEATAKGGQDEEDEG